MSTLQPTRPSARGGEVLYLDYDGVLHHERVYRHPEKGIYIAAAPQFTLFQHAGLLSDLLRPYPAVRIVLSTSWVRTFGFSRAASYLPEELRSRVIGDTFQSRMSEPEFSDLPRGQQVYEDYLRRAPSKVLALDDVEEGWPPSLREHLVVTDNVHGISSTSVQEELKTKLASHFAADPRSTS